MYRLYAITIFLIIKSCNTALIHPENVKFNANGAPTVTRRSNFAETSPGMVKVYILEDKKEKGEVIRTKSIISGDNNVTISGNSPIVINVKNADASKPANVENKKQDKDLATKVNRQNKDDKSSHLKLVYITNTEELLSNNKEKGSKKKDLSANRIETRRISKFNVYVPISEDINPLFDEDLIGKGVGRRGLKLIDLQGNVLEIPLIKK